MESASPCSKNVKKRELNVKKAKKKHLRRAVTSCKKVMDHLKTSVDGSLEQHEKYANMEADMTMALDAGQGASAKMLNSGKPMKAVWRAAHPENEGSIFETKIVTKTIKSQSYVGGSFCGFGSSATVGGSHDEQNSQMQGTREEKESKFHFECEGCYGRLDNALLETILKGVDSE